MISIPLTLGALTVAGMLIGGIMAFSDRATTLHTMLLEERMRCRSSRVKNERKREERLRALQP
jgi:hypothetical protein